MTQLFHSGLIVDLILVFVFLELVLLVLWLKRRGRPLTIVRGLGMVLPGVFLLLALRLALVDGNWVGVASFLTLALFAHLVDLWLRLSASA